LADFSGRVALVTGSSRGIGKGIALALADAGADVAVNYRSRSDEAEQVVEEIRKKGIRAEAIQADVSQLASVDEMVRAIASQIGPIDILVNNAGTAVEKDIDDISLEDFNAALASNLGSAFLCTQAVLPGMRERRWGRIVNISSIGARVGAGSVMNAPPISGRQQSGSMMPARARLRNTGLGNRSSVFACAARVASARGSSPRSVCSLLCS